VTLVCLSFLITTTSSAHALCRHVPLLYPLFGSRAFVSTYTLDTPSPFMCRHSLPLSAWITMGLVHLHGTSTFNSVDVLIRCQLLVLLRDNMIHQSQVCMPTPVMNFLGLSICAVYLVAAGHGEVCSTFLFSHSPLIFLHPDISAMPCWFCTVFPRGMLDVLLGYLPPLTSDCMHTQVHSLPSSAWITMRLIHLHGMSTFRLLVLMFSDLPYCCQGDTLLMC
jgi:hypothetical protein